MSEDEQTEDFQTLLEGSHTYIATLEEFNARLCEGSDQMGSLITEFLSWCQCLAEIGEAASAALRTDLAAKQLEGTPQCVGFCTELASVLERQVSSIVDDKYTADQVGESKALFSWFSDVSKCYSQFRPKLSCSSQNPFHNMKRVQRALDRKFSDILVKLAENVGARPADLSELNVIPATFPHHAIAYTLLLCRLVDAQTRLAFVEMSYRAHMDMIAVKRMFPSPNVLKGWDLFRTHVDDQNELIRVIVDMKRDLGQDCEGLGTAQAQVMELVCGFEQVVETYKCLCKESVDLMDELVMAQLRVRCLEFVRAHGVVTDDFEVPGRAALAEEEGKDEMAIEKICLTMQEMRDKLMKDIDVLKSHVACERPQSASAHGTFKEMLAQLDGGQKVAGQTASVLRLGDSIVGFMRGLSERLGSRELIRGQAVVAPAAMNLDGTIDFLKHKIETKQADEQAIAKEICHRRLDCDRVAAIGASLKYKAQNQEAICQDCEERRAYCLTKCGHTFCERCYNRIRESRVLKCPYPNCDPNKAQFAPEDVIRINWE